MGYEFRAEDVYSLAEALGLEHHRKGDEMFFRLCPYCGGGEHRDRDTCSVNLRTGAYNCFRASCGKQGHFVELARDLGYPLAYGNEDGKRFILSWRRNPKVTKACR